MLHTILAAATLLVKPERPTVETLNMQPATNTCVSRSRAVMPVNTLTLYDAKLQAALKMKLTVAFNQIWKEYVVKD
jgi:hypothetical protein